MRSVLASICVLACAASSLACGGDEASDTTGDSSSTSGGGGSGGGGTEVSCDGAPADLALGGTWAAKGRLTVRLQGAPGGAVTLCPESQEGEVTMLLLVTVEQDAADPTKLSKVNAALCSIDLPIVTAKVGDCAPGDTNLVSTQLIAPPALIDSFPNVPTEPATGTVAGTADGWGSSSRGCG